MPTLAAPPPKLRAAPRLAPPPAAGVPMVRVTPDAERVVLRNISWETYLHLIDDLGPAGGRMTYDNGVLEIEMPGVNHERTKVGLRTLFVAYCRERGRDVTGAGSTTFRREVAARGLEPDECYYVEHADEPAVLRQVDDALIPPDIAIEVDLSSGSVPKEPIYADLGVPEVWRWADGRLAFRRLVDGGYQDAPRSRFLPGFDPAWADQIVPLAGELSDLKLERAFLDLVRAGQTAAR